MRLRFDSPVFDPEFDQIGVRISADEV